MVCGVAAARASEGETKVALIIGNARYTSSTVPALDTPANDAKDMAESLKKIGFDVVLKTDLTQADFSSTLAEFDRAASNSDIALFYFAGHGVQYKGQNYFLPVDIVPKDNASIKFESVAMSSIVDATNEARKVKIIILDACRNSVPDRVAAKSRAVTGMGDASGLAPISGTDGMIVFYSAEHGKVALDSSGSSKNSPFAQSLVNRILESGCDIKHVFTDVENDVKIATAEKQHPEIVSDEVTSNIFLNPAETAADAWLRIHKSRNPSDFKKFMRDFPDLPQADDAAIMLDDLDRQQRDAEREAADKKKKAEEEDARQKQAEFEKRAAEVKAAEQARLEKERAEKEAAAKALADKQAQIEAEKKAAEELIAEEKRKADAAAAEHARQAKEAADREAEAKRLAEEAAMKKRLAEEADAAHKEAERQKAEEAAREAADAQEAAKKAEAQKQQAKLEEQERKQQAAEAAAKAIADACARDQGELARLKDARQSGAIQALKSQSVCPAVPAAADQAVKEIAAYDAKVCADDQKKLSGTDSKNETALKAALDTLTCDAVRQSASNQIAKLDAESLRLQQICVDERAKFAGIDQFVPGARGDLAALQAKAQCVPLRKDLASAIADVDKRVASTQEELQRLGCYRVKPMSGRFDSPTVKALTDYLKARHATDSDTAKITAGFVDELKSQDFQICAAPIAPAASSSPTASSPPAQKRVLARPSILLKPKQERSNEAGSPQPHRAVVERTAPAPGRTAKPAAPQSAPGIPFIQTF